MKVALVILHADRTRGGAERYTVDLAAVLARRSHDVSLLASRFAHVPDGIATVKLDAGGATRTRRYQRFLDSLDAHLAHSSYDIVHAMLAVHRCDFYHPHAGIVADNVARGHLRRAGGVARALSWAGNRLNFHRTRMAAIERNMLTGPQPPIVICLSDAQRRVLLEHYPHIGDRAIKLFNAVDLAQFDPASAPAIDVPAALGVAGDQVLALLIAQNWSLKGVRQAIEAIARVGDKRLVLAVVGKDDPEPYQQLARALGVQDQVRFPGPTRDAKAFYQAADFFVLPTRSDQCSLVVLEALAMGVPVISTIANGATEIMGDDLHGYVLEDANDVAALAVAMQNLLDSQRRDQMSKACLTLRPQLSYEHHLDRLSEIYALKGHHVS